MSLDTAGIGWFRYYGFLLCEEPAAADTADVPIPS
ncbi:hypothetical protein BVRB_031430 [Beta vulgaris subsp. vulgaris]|uniref:Uncharacterized protein n=1 Tax=Beta vulgaris subsp. vulgaris TaxID=3555 RepID=A0A0J8B0J5_BETVV|nr:hypothetical protein BVRB_031430 [Beta vulgaris subsp. vulgaris]